MDFSAGRIACIDRQRRFGSKRDLGIQGKSIKSEFCQSGLDFDRRTCGSEKAELIFYAPLFEPKPEEQPTTHQPLRHPN
jgi:hypothetical protein